MDNEYLFCRQPFVDKQQQIVGYELRLINPNAIKDDESAVLANTINKIESPTLPKGRLLFISFPKNTANDQTFSKLPHEVILDIPHITTAEEKELVKTLSKQGFEICLSDFIPTPDALELLPLSKYIKINVRELGLERAIKLSSELKKHTVKQILSGVETGEAFQSCAKINPDLIQGNYFIRPVIDSKKTISPSMANILNLMRMAQQDAPIAQMEKVLKADAALSYKLLRYINSVGFGLSCEITSYQHAVTILGYKKLYRWLSLLMVTAGKETNSPAVIKTAAIRGRLSELIGQQYLEQKEGDNLFLAGLFSLLDVILHMSMQEALEQISLSKDLNDALLQREGVYGTFIDLIEACEQNDTKRLEKVAGSLHISPSTINAAHLLALCWVEGLGI